MESTSVLSSRLSHVDFWRCGLVDALSVRILDAIISDRLQCVGFAPLSLLRLSSTQLDASVTQGLGDAWTRRWHERARVTVTGDMVTLAVLDEGAN